MIYNKGSSKNRQALPLLYGEREGSSDNWNRQTGRRRLQTDRVSQQTDWRRAVDSRRTSIGRQKEFSTDR
jgi:hypothetical protein